MTPRSLQRSYRYIQTLPLKTSLVMMLISKQPDFQEILFTSLSIMRKEFIQFGSRYWALEHADYAKQFGSFWIDMNCIIAHIDCAISASTRMTSPDAFDYLAASCRRMFSVERNLLLSSLLFTALLQVATKIVSYLICLCRI